MRATVNLYLVLLDLCLVQWYCEIFVFCPSTNQTAGLSKLQNSRNNYAILNMCIDIVWLNILIASKLIKCLCLVIVRQVQRSLGELHSKILETPVTQEKF